MSGSPRWDSKPLVTLSAHGNTGILCNSHLSKQTSKLLEHGVFMFLVCSWTGGNHDQHVET